MSLEAIRKEAAIAKKLADAAKESKQEYERILLDEIPVYKEAKTALTIANARFKVADEAYRQALTEIFKLTGSLPEDEFVSVSVVRERVLDNEQDVIKELIKVMGDDAAQYFILDRSRLTNQDLIDLGGTLTTNESLKTEIAWKALVQRHGDSD